MTSLLATEAATASSSPTRGALFAAGPFCLDVRTNEDWAAQLLATAYAPMHCTDAALALHHASLLRLRDGTLRLRFDEREVPYSSATHSDPFTRSFYALHELFARFAAIIPGQIALYGASVVIDGGAVLLLGPTTIGKTVLALHLAHRGAHFLGDETVLFDPQYQTVAAMPQRPSLREPSLALLPTPALRRHVEAAPHAIHTRRGRFWYALRRLDLQGIGPDPWPYPLRAIVIVKGRAPEPTIETFTARTMLAMVLERAYARPQALAQVGALHRALRAIPSFALTLGPPDQSARALMDIINACA